MSVENWSGSMKDKLIESAITAGSFMVIDKLYYKSPRYGVVSQAHILTVLLFAPYLQPGLKESRLRRQPL